MNSEARELEEAGLSPRQAAAEAGRCLNCYDAPCVKGCPAGVDIPVFVKKVWSQNWRGAARVIREANVFGGTCARVCPTEELCEKECSSRLLGRAIPIGALQRLACERGGTGMAGGSEGPAGSAKGTAAAAKAASKAAVPGAAAKRAAIVGAGPAGLSAAWELGSRGWDVTVYEASDRLGGQLDATIPPYRLPPEVVRAEAAAITAAGVKVKTGSRVRPADAAALLADNDAVILATGLGGGRPSGVEGEDRPGVVSAEDFLAGARKGGLHGPAGKAGALQVGGKRVAVIGGGNTAMDAAVTAKAAGASRATVIYRRSAAEMPAWPREYRGALEAGVEFLWQAQPVAFEGEGRDGHVAAVRCVRMALGQPDASGRATPTPVAGSEFAIEANLVVMALGQGPNQEIIEAFGLAVDKAGRPVSDKSGRASRAGGAPPALLSKPGRAPGAAVFVCGDLASGGATVVRAVAEGKKVARAAAGEGGEA